MTRTPSCTGDCAAGRVALQVRHDSVAGHEAIGIALIVRMAGQLQGPVRRDQAEAVPPVPPGLTHPALFEHDVRNARSRELATDRESGLTAADDDSPDTVVHCTGHPMCGMRRSGEHFDVQRHPSGRQTGCHRPRRGRHRLRFRSAGGGRRPCMANETLRDDEAQAPARADRDCLKRRAITPAPTEETTGSATKAVASPPASRCSQWTTHRSATLGRRPASKCIARRRRAPASNRSELEHRRCRNETCGEWRGPA